MADPALRARLADAAKQNVRRFARANVMAMWDDLVTGIRPGKADVMAGGLMRPRSETP
jgi:hypothetical protein